MKQTITIRTPGKLMIAGEYAVLEKNYPLVVTAVNRYLSTTIRDSDINLVTLADLNLQDISWSFINDSVTFHHSDHRLHFIRDAFTTVVNYLNEKQVKVTPFSLLIKSELDDEETGKKYGLGSSAAVVTSVVAALLHRFLPNEVNREIIFKLAAIAHVTTQGSGSGADIAASTFGGVLKYRSFQAEWLLEKIATIDSVIELIESEWTYLMIEPLTLPDNVEFYVGWTGNPASTVSLVGQVKTLKTSNLTAYEQFLTESEVAVGLVVDGIKMPNISKLFKGINRNREALQQLGETVNVPIETRKLHILGTTAAAIGGAGKLSGAGGGDCGIAFLLGKEKREQLLAEWIKADIEPLDIGVCTLGVHVFQ